MNAPETWNSGLLEGWTNNNAYAAVSNPGTYLNLHFGALGVPSPEESILVGGTGASGGDFTGNYLAAGATNIALKFLAAGYDPGLVRFFLHNPTSGNAWYTVLAAPVTNEWTEYNIPLDYDAALWLIGSGESRDQFLRDLENVDWVGVYVLRSGGTSAEDYGLDDVALGGSALSVAGNCTYAGSQTGRIHVVVTSLSNSWDTTRSASQELPGRFYVTQIESPGDYYVKAWRDSDGDGQFDSAEAWGAYAGNPLTIGGNVTGIDVALADPDSDTDGLPDWVETDTGIYAGPTDTGSSPTNSDTDLDGLSDGDEVGTHGTNPNLADSDLDGYTDAQELAMGTDPNDETDYPGSAVAVSAPASNAVAVCGTMLDVSWVGAWALGTADITLMTGTGVWTLAEDVAAPASNMTVEVFLPVTLPYGTAWQVRVTDDSHPLDYGDSGVFTIRRRTPCDFDGDGIADLAVYYPAGGDWYAMRSQSGFQHRQFGWSEPTPVPADYDGDGKADVAVYHAPAGTWYVLMSTDGFALRQFGFGGTLPVPADYDADGVADLGVYHPAGGTWYIMQSADGFRQVQFGWSEPRPVPADYDGDGKADIALYHRTAANWYMLCSHTGFRMRPFGWYPAVAVPGDYDGDRIDDLAVYYPPTGTWFVFQSSTGKTAAYQFGWNGPAPVPADYDGDGITDLALYHRATGTWYIFNSATQTVRVETFGWSAAGGVTGTEY
ncbi:MAG: VCBS repeat-containing protein [Kiritimatiellae bacterium]|nr:VCBS repeat-containing protein [Kiritimatiellia bacterium]